MMKSHLYFSALENKFKSKGILKEIDALLIPIINQWDIEMEEIIVIFFYKNRNINITDDVRLVVHLHLFRQSFIHM